MVSAKPENDTALEKRGRFAFFKHGPKDRPKLSKRPSDELRASDPTDIAIKRNAMLLLDDIEHPLPDSVIESEFNLLGNSVEAHVCKFYQDGQGKEVNQFAVEHATTGLSIPWLTILSLLGQEDTRMRAICLCISWTLLSRSLLLKLGLSSSPGSTFLPPEIVECFQSFSSVLSGAMSGGAERQEGAPPSLPPMQRAVPVHVPNLTSLEVARGKRTGLTRGPDERVVHFALLSRWKQISATLMHSTYVRDSFSHFDSRTINIERAINDLDPLLRTYASTNPMDNEARLTDLRDILRQGAKFAFLLFSQPCFWQFDWKEEVGKGKGTWAVAMGNGNPVVWPNLMRVMNEEGKRLEVPDVLGRKRFLRDGE